MRRRGIAKPEHAADLKADAAKVLRLLNGYLAYLQGKQKEKEATGTKARPSGP